MNLSESVEKRQQNTLKVVMASMAIFSTRLQRFSKPLKSNPKLFNHKQFLLFTVGIKQHNISYTIAIRIWNRFHL